MKKTILSLVIVFAVLLSACDYRYIPSDGRIIVLFGKDYFYTDMSAHSIITDGEKEKEVKLYRDKPVEFDEYVYTKLNLPEEVFMYRVENFSGWFEHPVIFVQDGYDMPTFKSADKVEDIYYIEGEHYSTYYALPESEKGITGDAEAFVEELFGYCTEFDSNSSWKSRNIDVDFGKAVGQIVYKFRDIDGLMFNMWVLTTDKTDMYYIFYTIDETFYSILFPKELLGRYFPIAS